MIWWKTSLRELQNSEKLATLEVDYPLDLSVLPKKIININLSSYFLTTEKHIYPFISILYL